MTSEFLAKAGGLSQAGHARDSAAFFETLFALSNGTIGLRGTVDHESEAAIPGAFHSAVYAPGYTVPSEIVNLPNWSPLRVRASDAEAPSLDGDALEEFRRVLDYRRAEVVTRARIRLGAGLTVRLIVRQLVHSAEPHLTVTTGTLTAVRGRGRCRVESLVDWRRGNMFGGGHTPSTRLHHCEVTDVRAEEGTGLFVACGVRGTSTRVEIASLLRVEGARGWRMAGGLAHAAESVEVELDENTPVRFERIAVCTAGGGARDLLRAAADAGTRTLVTRHRAVWSERWRAAACAIEGDASANARLQFGRFHLLQAMPFDADDANLPARGLTSEYHSGHFFFNTEVFKLPFFLFVAPDRARALVRHRFNRLAAAEAHAAESGARGARFPEETAPGGFPATPHVIEDVYARTRVVEWSGEKTKFISALVAIAADAYVRATGDADFASTRTLPLLVATARYGASIMTERADGTFSIPDVMCADEYHYGVEDDAFTNETIRRNLVLAVEACRGERPEALAALGVEAAEIEDWTRRFDALRRPASFGDGVLEQFAGYAALPDATVRARDANGRPVLDEATRQAATDLLHFGNRLIKEGDVILLHDLLPDLYDAEQQARDFAFYEPRTTMESSLAAVPYAVTAARLGDAAAARLFQLSAGYNVDYHPREDYRNGVHLAACGGAWRVLFSGFLGHRFLREDAGVLHLSPGPLPEEWSAIRVRFVWRGATLEAVLDHEGLRLEHVWGPDVRVRVGGAPARPGPSLTLGMTNRTLVIPSAARDPGGGYPRSSSSAGRSRAAAKRS